MVLIIQIKNGIIKNRICVDYDLVHGACVNRPNDMASSRNQSGKSVFNIWEWTFLQYAT